MAYWKAACDLEIKDALEDDGVDVEGLLLQHHFDLDPYHSAEHYYQQLVDAAVLDAVPDCGPVCAAHPIDWQLGPDGEEGFSDIQRGAIRQATAKLILQHQDGDGLYMTQTAGVCPRGCATGPDKPQAPKPTGASCSRGCCDTACTPKQAPATTPGSALGPLRPVLAVPTGQIAVVLDTSGSMGQEDHAQAFSEIDAVLTKAVPGVAVTVLSVDDDIDSIRRVTHTRQIAPLGGGGTDMAAGIESVAQACPAAIVVITDGYTRWPPSPPRARAV